VLADEREEKRGWWPWARRVGAAGVVWVVAHGASAHDGNELLKHCLEPIETAESSYCLGYISAAADILGDDICVPKEVNRGQMNDIAVRYLQAHPELRQRSGVDLAEEALKAAFPCKR
jgi:Rap1a immunity proteins